MYDYATVIDITVWVSLYHFASFDTLIQARYRVPTLEETMYPYSFSRYQAKYVIKFLFRQLMT